MTISTTYTPNASDRLNAFFDRIVPRVGKFDPFGIVSGYRAYALYTNLNARSDAELAKMDLARTDLPRVAMEAVWGDKRA